MVNLTIILFIDEIYASYKLLGSAVYVTFKEIHLSTDDVSEV